MSNTRLNNILDPSSPFYSSNDLQSNAASNETFIVPLDIFLRWSHTGPINAFMKLAASGGNPINLKSSCQSFCNEETRFKKGIIDEATFRKNVNSMFNIHLSDVDFDQVWNTQLGDTFVLLQNLESLKAAGLNIILISVTNSIHARAISNIALPFPIYLSIQNDLTLPMVCTQAIEMFKSDLEHTTIILGRNSNVTDIETWANQHSIKVHKLEASRYIVADLVRLREESNISNSSYGQQLSS